MSMSSLETGIVGSLEKTMKAESKGFTVLKLDALGKQSKLRGTATTGFASLGG